MATPIPIPAFAPLLSPVGGGGRDVCRLCGNMGVEGSVADWAEEVGGEEITSADEGEVVGVTATVAGPVAVIVMVWAYVVCSPCAELMMRGGPSTP
jgi:hypothetical protein